MRIRTLSLAVLCMLGCDGDGPASPEIGYSLSGSSAVVTGGGEFLLGGFIPFDFSVSGVQHADGSATGEFRFSAHVDPFVYAFHARVVCVAVDRVNHRAWIGGVITENRSTDPDLQLDIHQPGRDVWFRVLDNGEGEQTAADRMTFIGFTGSAGVITSQEYCDRQLWLNEGQVLSKGNIQVR